MKLTPLAEELAIPVRELLQQAEAVIHRTPSFSPDTSERTFRVAMSDYVATVFLARVLPELQRQAPGIMIEVAAPRPDALERGKADLVIMPEQYLPSDHPVERLFEDEFVCIVCASNKLVKGSLSMRDYLRLPHVVVRFGELQELPTVEDVFLEKIGQSRRIDVVTAGFTLVPQYVVGTKRIGTVHRRLAELYARQLPIKILKSPIEMATVVEAMQWHTVRNIDPALVWLRQLFKTFA